MEITCWKTILYVLVVYRTLVNGQGDGFQNAGGVSSVSNILQGSSILESAAMGIASAAAEFVKIAPTVPGDHKQGGLVHVDLPGQHGNIHNFAVVHRDVHPAHSAGGDITLDMKPAVGTEPFVSRGIFHGSNVFHNAAADINSFVDLAALGGPIKPPVAITDGFPDVPVATHIDKGNADGFLPATNMHVDKLNIYINIGEHGNIGNTAVVHRELVHRNPTIPVPAYGLGNVHVDLPGEHGNTGNTAVIHREIGIPMPNEVHPVGLPLGDHRPHGAGNVHIDLPGEHGNTPNTPVVHRETGKPYMGPIGGILSPVETTANPDSPTGILALSSLAPHAARSMGAAMFNTINRKRRKYRKVAKNRKVAQRHEKERNEKKTPDVNKNFRVGGKKKGSVGLAETSFFF